MLLTDNVIQKIKDYENLTQFQISTEKVTNVCYRVKLLSSNVEVCIDVEEQDSYLSFIISQMKNGKTYIYQALSDYSNVSGEQIPLFTSSRDERKFYDRVNRAIKNHRKLLSKDKNGDEVVTCILSFINEFVVSLNK